MSEPRTDAGRALLDGFAPLPAPIAPELHRRSAMGRRVKLHAGIAAIEDAERERIAAAVRDAFRWPSPWRPPAGLRYDEVNDEWGITEAAVLAVIMGEAQP